ncbi:hypothetical protein GLOIN_2v1488565 [Rhizophagus irregularis DAOM 181602=DAOM 197198]|uniref:Uncharacterized protein n=1 Tax=Rhizophagus irregularis (strain DAOM 181602 / DAOM 197198 / MUCL 43194) TaxID=747089 RepID=A0A2P4NZC9_RHIID|nr:hypothetical protein GLOIN_2v1488565 [Rhizophagus irregularis DAOM 181602=DAOM 197198]POG58484.1 hypothetical protein GLOIN_2v1488565 [Rhizophagus irregularis DAOM 181602=DAOM 197198]|eukprot:XP_025165350.1 hypothetical protein GLOIN_2v1488565 [Rhizophagus irregularis DAOM 181602=DAOM 197198]
MSMAFMHSFTKEDYIKLEECLDDERKLLSQVFKDFENLPNLHINLHLIQHVKNYTTLLNTGVGTKEMMHRIFKTIMSRTNRKNVELDLLKRYTTLFAVRHLFDGVHLPDERISKITLKKCISRRKGEDILPNDADFHRELAISYRDMGYHLAIFGYSCQFYEYACFFAEENDTNVLHQLHIGEIVTIVTEDDETFAIIRSIFSHQYNNQQFAFVSVDGFEITNRTVLECPVFKLRSTNRQ